MKLKKIWPIILIGVIGSFIGFFLAKNFFDRNVELISSFKEELLPKEKSLPLKAYSIPHLAKQEFSASAPLEILSENEPGQLIFNYRSGDKKISGIINFDPRKIAQNYPVILMLRGWVPAENYYPGLGTKSAAEVFAAQGYLTIAPDFLGYGSSDPELADSWENRFIKPVQIAELIATIKAYPQFETELGLIKLDPARLGIWAHSNGGQIALSTLEIIPQGLATSLWAPVTAPFPYSVLFFSDEMADEGKETRKWLSLFEKDYDVFDFSLSKHLDLLKGPLQIHHGTADEAALISWSDEFVEKIDLENEKREASGAAQIELNYYRYPGADHNLQPSWNSAMQRDLIFFAKHLAKD